MDRNLIEAAKWYQKAAEQGNIDAQCSLDELQNNINKLDELQNKINKDVKHGLDKSLVWNIKQLFRKK